MPTLVISGRNRSDIVAEHGILTAVRLRPGRRVTFLTPDRLAAAARGYR
jgi:hypothetical protein